MLTDISKGLDSFLGCLWIVALSTIFVSHQWKSRRLDSWTPLDIQPSSHSQITPFWIPRLHFNMYLPESILWHNIMANKTSWKFLATHYVVTQNTMSCTMSCSFQQESYRSCMIHIDWKEQNKEDEYCCGMLAKVYPRLESACIDRF